MIGKKLRLKEKEGRTPLFCIKFLMIFLSQIAVSTELTPQINRSSRCRWSTSPGWAARSAELIDSLTLAASLGRGAVVSPLVAS